MKIVIVVGFHWHAPSMATALEKLGHETLTITTNPGAFSTPTRKVKARTMLRVAGRFEVGRSLANRIFGLLAKRHVRSAEPDLVIAWSSFALDAVRATEKPTIVVRGSHHIRTQNELIEKPIPRSIIHLEELEYAECDLITVPTTDIAADERWPQGKMVVSPYAFPEVRQALTKPAPTPDEEMNLIFVGEVSHRKGADRLQMVDQCHGVGRLDVIGGNGNSIGLPRKARALGHLPKEEVFRALADSHAMILLSREEGMARAGLEAMALGLPLIATPRTGLGDWCRKGAGVCLSDEPTQDEFNDAVDRVRDSYAEMSQAAIRLSGSWAWEDHVSALLDAAASGPLMGTKDSTGSSTLLAT